jgi:hypothetical protein
LQEILASLMQEVLRTLISVRWKCKECRWNAVDNPLEEDYWE